MGNFNIMGSYSGIDMSVIDQMIEAEKAKGVQFTNRKDKIEREQGAWKDVGTRLTSLGQKSDILARSGTFKSRTVKSSATGNAAVSVTAGNSAPIGDYRVHVKQLATSSRLTGGKIKFPEPDLNVKNQKPMDIKLGQTESFKFKNADGKAFEIKVTADDSLRTITENINKETEKSGIRASIVDNRLILTDTNMGNREISIETNNTSAELGFRTSTMVGNKVDLRSFQGGTFSFGLVNETISQITISADDTLTEIKEKINEHTKGSGVTASIDTDGRLVLSGEGEIIAGTGIDDAAAKALGFVDTTTTFAEIGVEGKFTIGDHTVDIKSTDTLDEIVNKINAKTTESGITASIENNKLVLTDKDGANVTIGDDTDLATNLKNLDNNPITETTVKSGSTLTSEVDQGQDAIFTIDGLEIRRDTNQISDVIEGMAFTLTSKHAEGETELISVTNNTQKGVDAVKEFVDQYNSVMNFIQTQTDVGAPSEDNNTTGALVGEGSIMRLQSGLRSLLTNRIGGNSNIRAASDLGITTDRYGVASLDEAKLAQLLREDPESVARFFYKPEATEVETVENGDRSVDQSKGMSELFKNIIETYTARSKGIISTKNSSYDRMIKQINEQIETFNERIDRKRDRYIKQFAALDEAMMRAESQMEYLYSQMNIE